jgi:DNA-binding winged helix-turn-helix (wHTH) protein
VLFEFDDFVLDESAYELRRGGAELKVDPKVIDVLAYMLRRPGQLVTKRELVAHVWEGRTLSETVLTGAVSKLRKALGFVGRGQAHRERLRPWLPVRRRGEVAGLAPPP